MVRRPPRSTLDRSSAASDVYKRQGVGGAEGQVPLVDAVEPERGTGLGGGGPQHGVLPVSYTHLRAHETVLDLVCRLLLEKKKKTT